MGADNHLTVVPSNADAAVEQSRENPFKNHERAFVERKLDEHTGRAGLFSACVRHAAREELARRN